MERWWTERVCSRQPRVELAIDGHALKGSCDSFVEEAKEDSADEDGEHKHDQERAPSISKRWIWSNEEEDEALKNEDEEVSH